MDEVIATGVAGVQVRIHDSQGDWSAAAGATMLGGDQPVPTNARFRVGRITKMFTAAVVRQLVGEGVLGLDDPVARYLPSFGLDERITVRMILGHQRPARLHRRRSRRTRYPAVEPVRYANQLPA
ncbi:serine hydrolase domain-containing protein [Nocardia salmonicida]|uniref:serine hydrolase domain-containing protein n=1 Tax=Nocardia salmonicida TaxID=53431 RepID=UPI00364926E7